MLRDKDVTIGADFDSPGTLRSLDVVEDADEGAVETRVFEYLVRIAARHQKSTESGYGNSAGCRLASASGGDENFYECPSSPGILNDAVIRAGNKEVAVPSKTEPIRICQAS